MPRSLDRYREMRDFGATPEPAGHVPAAAGRRKHVAGEHGVFVVQKHAARSLHYDFRLELDGVLVSWAVPKGPSTSVGVRRLAVRTEDHPLEYADFEGDIPSGLYGAGHVDIWDRGRWRSVGDAQRGLDEGRLEFDLEGKRLQGRFALVRLKSGDGERHDNWLLMRRRDPASGDRVGRTRARPTRGAGRRGGSRAEERVIVAGVAISNASRPIPGEQGLTKLDVVRYYESVAQWLLPELDSRPLSLIRCPGGDFDKCFFRRRPEDEAEVVGDIPFVRVKNLRELVASVQGGTIEFHSWGSTLPRLDRPDRLTFDLDPDPALPWKIVREAAELVRALLDQLGIRWFLKTTGGKGLHFVVPMARRAGWDDAKDFARRCAEHLANTLPALFTASASKAKRKGRVYVDYLRNAEGASAVCAYSLRARRGFPVSMPIPWEALDNDVRGDWYNLANVPQALALRKQDPWAGYAGARQSLAHASRSLGK